MTLAPSHRVLSFAHPIKGIFSEVLDYSNLLKMTSGAEENTVADDAQDELARPHSVFLYPIFSSLAKDKNGHHTVGAVAGIVPWDFFLQDLLPDGASGITVVLESSCEQAFTYAVDGKSVRSAADSRKLSNAGHLSLTLSRPISGHLPWSWRPTRRAA